MHSFMRSVGRFLLRAAEFLWIQVGMILSLALAYVTDPLGHAWGPLVLLSGLVLTVVCLVIFRRKTRPWKIRYDAESWRLNQIERRLHPGRARFRQIAKRILIWVPAAMAALVLFFFPIASHLVHPSSRYLGHYRIPIHWTYTVFAAPQFDLLEVVINSGVRGRFGTTPFLITPFWMVPEPLSLATFESATNPSSFNFEKMAASIKESSLIRRFQLGDEALTCWQYRPRDQHVSFSAGGDWYVTCAAPTAAHERYFSAHFRGRREDLRAFYQIIEGVRPLP